MPDGGLFTASQLRRGADLETLSGQMPERGAIEVKSSREDAESTANGEQVMGYLDRYGLVLASNLRDFILVQKTSGGVSQTVERYTLAGDESPFWQMTRSPRQSADLHNERLVEFLKRAVLYRAELSEPKDLAWFLASYASDAHAKVDAAGDLPALATLRQAMQQALNMEFASEKGEHFFRSTLVQNLFYGVFSTWCSGIMKTRPPARASTGTRPPTCSKCRSSSRYFTSGAVFLRPGTAHNSLRVPLSPCVLAIENYGKMTL
jgi:hypothetical protein